MITFANAKINLGLNIVSKRPDGYHDLETVFYPAGKGCGRPDHPGTLNDVLELIPSEYDSLTQLGLKADCPAESNLVMKALRLFREEAAKKGAEVSAMQVILEKHIPFGAGIGGGSADATFMLLALNGIYRDLFNKEELRLMANKLGADCPFFVENRPMFAQGTGEKLTPVGLDLSDYWLGLVKPDVSISTREAFSCVTPQTPEISAKEIVQRPIGEWRDLLTNDFEVSAFNRFPELRSLKDTLYSNGALYASMSGSGSSFFGIFPDQESALLAVKATLYPYQSVTKLLP